MNLARLGVCFFLSFAAYIACGMLLPVYALPMPTLPQPVLAGTILTCADPSIYGITKGAVYCIKTYMLFAVNVYVDGLNSTALVTTYQAACITLAIALFGWRIMTLGSDDIIKDSMFLLIKIAIAVFLATKAAAIYTAAADGMGQLMGMVGGFLGSIIKPTAVCDAGVTQISVLKTANDAMTSILNPTTGTSYTNPALNSDEYIVWHLFDCALLRMFGLSFLGSSMAFTSMIPLFAAALFTSALGVMLVLIGLAFYFVVVLVMVRSVYLVLLSYFALAMAAIFTPVAAPLLVFYAHQPQSTTRAYFDKWLGFIASTMLQPIFIIGYLAFMIAAIDAFIEGDLSDIPAIKAVFNTCAPDSDSSGICSFNQLYGISSGLGYKNELEPNYVLFSWHFQMDPQNNSKSGGYLTPIVGWFKEKGYWLLNKAIDWLNPFTVKVTRLKPTQKIMQLFITLCAALATTLIMFSLSRRIPLMAQMITQTFAVNMFKAMAIPLETVISSGITAAAGVARASPVGRGLLLGGKMSGLTHFAGAMKRGGREGARVMKQEMTRGRNI